MAAKKHKLDYSKITITAKQLREIVQRDIQNLNEKKRIEIRTLVGEMSGKSNIQIEAVLAASFKKNEMIAAKLLEIIAYIEHSSSEMKKEDARLVKLMTTKKEK